MRKFSTSVVSPTSVQSVNPLSSVTTIAKSNQSPTQINHATSGYLSEDSSNNDKAGNVHKVGLCASFEC